MKPLTRPFSEIVIARLRRDPEFARALEAEAAASEITEPDIASDIRKWLADARVSENR